MVWCNVYPLHYLTISKKVQTLVVAFSKLDRYPKKKRGASFLEKEAEFLSEIDKLFDVFCNDNEQRRRLEKDHKLRMTDEDFVFYEDQKSRRIGKCLDVALPLTSSDQKFIRRSESRVNTMGVLSGCSVNTQHSLQSIDVIIDQYGFCSTFINIFIWHIVSVLFSSLLK